MLHARTSEQVQQFAHRKRNLAIETGEGQDGELSTSTGSPLSKYIARKRKPVGRAAASDSAPKYRRLQKVDQPDVGDEAGVPGDSNQNDKSESAQMIQSLKQKVEEVHSNLQNVLSEPRPLPNHQRECITCTIATSLSSESSEPNILIFIAAGHLTSVPIYKWNGKNSSWKISTFHTKSPCQATEIASEMGLKDAPFQNPAYAAFSSSHNLKLLDELHPALFQSSHGNSFRSRYVLGDMTVHVGDTIHFVLSSDDGKTELDAVRGIFAQGSTSECCHVHDSDDSDDSLSSTSRDDVSIADRLHALNEPEDSLIVTVIYTSFDNEENKKLMLFECIAGAIDDDMVLTGSQALSTEVFMNDDIHNQIAAEWNSTFLQKLSAKEQAQWKKNCPAFVVTSQFPFRNNSLIADVMPYELHRVNLRHAVSFYHPKESKLFHRVFKPRSPSDQEHGLPSGERAFSKLSLQKNQNDPTRPMRQKNLELEQMRIYKCLRELDMSNGDMDPRSALTMITLSVLKEAGNGFDASSSVFCLQGIVCDVGPKLFHLELNKKPGWTISTHWITNPEMSQKMGQQWEDTLSKLSHDETREFAKGVLVFAKLNHMQQLEFKFPVFPRRGDATINDENSTMSFSSANSQLMCEIKAVHGGETNSRKFYRKVEEIKHGKAIVYEKLQTTRVSEVLDLPDVQASDMQKEGDHLTIHSHRVTTKLKSAGSGKNIKVVSIPENTVVCIMAEEVSPNIDDRLQDSAYHDPMNSWEYETSIVEANDEGHRRLLTHVKKGWENNTTNKVARFALFKQSPAQTGLTSVRLRPKETEVRNRSTHVDIHAHNTRTKPLLCHILDDKTLRPHFESIVKKHDSLKQKFDQSTNSSDKIKSQMMEDCDTRALFQNLKQLPTSFKYPTLGIVNTILPRPNHMCLPDPMVHGACAYGPVINNRAFPRNNNAHIKFSKAGEEQRKLDIDVLCELIELFNEEKCGSSA